MIDFALTEQQLHWQAVARDFACREVAPVAKERERIRDPRERMPWDLVRKASAVGLRTLAIPTEWGGAGADCLALCLAAEELAVADLGFSVVLDQCWKFTPMLCILANDDQKERFLKPYVQDPEYLLATTWTEEQSGSDNMLPYDVPEAGVRLRAVRRGDEWVLNGKKVFTSNGSVAKLYFVYGRTNAAVKPSEGVSCFLVPRDSPGLSFGQNYDKIGQRLVINSEEILEDVRIPAANLLGPEGHVSEFRRKYMIRGNVEAAATALGPGRAAYEAALDYARRRVQGGRPIVERQAVAMMLAEMAMRLEAARQTIWRAAWATDHQDPYDRKLSPLSKIFASEVAFDVCTKAMEVAGGMSATTDAPFEKYLRDASTFLHSDGTNQVLRLRIATLL
ncbi:MAG: acyl-CoA dehydrogenase family protein [Chloroflexi bacterium]|nr:acyl-CoA dehydrogenase family protein [Chloroflexota bacterium]